MVSIRLILALAVIVVAFVISTNAAYKKPPFNGSIFGKRSNTITGKFCIIFVEDSLKTILFYKVKINFKAYST